MSDTGVNIAMGVGLGLSQAAAVASTGHTVLAFIWGGIVTVAVNLATQRGVLP